MQVTSIPPFKFKQFEIQQDQCPMKVGTDGILLGAWADVADAKHVLDIGTGTGLIAIMLGQRNELAKIDAVEIDECACSQASANMQAAPWSDRLQAIPVAIQDFAQSAQQSYDLIVSNPPFFSGGTFSDKADRNQVRHTVKLPHGDLLRAVQKLLAKDGKFALILPLIEGLRFEELAQNYNLYCTKRTEVFPRADKNVERLLLQFEQQPKPIIKEQLIVQKGAIANDWTEAYQALTGMFYL
ncbi:MAG: methyltransferase [Bacteroidota bacterium]